MARIRKTLEETVSFGVAEDFQCLKKHAQFRITNPEGWRLARAMFDGVRCVAVATYNSTQSGCQRFKL